MSTFDSAFDRIKNAASSAGLDTGGAVSDPFERIAKAAASAQPGAAPGAAAGEQDLQQIAAADYQNELVIPEVLPMLPEALRFPSIQAEPREVERGLRQTMAQAAQAIATPGLRAKFFESVLDPWFAVAAPYARPMAPVMGRMASQALEPSGSGLTVDDLRTEQIAARGAAEGMAAGQQQGVTGDVARAIGQTLPQFAGVAGAIATGGAGLPVVAANIASQATLPLSAWTGGQLAYLDEIDAKRAQEALEGKELSQYSVDEMQRRATASAMIQTGTEVVGAGLAGRAIGTIGAKMVNSKVGRSALGALSERGAPIVQKAMASKAGQAGAEAFARVSQGTMRFRNGFFGDAARLVATSAAEEGAEELGAAILEAPFTEAPLSKDLSDGLYSAFIGSVAGGIGGGVGVTGAVAGRAIKNRQDAFRPETDAEIRLRQLHSDAMKARTNWTEELDDTQQAEVAVALNNLNGMNQEERGIFLRELSDRRAQIRAKVESLLAHRQDLDAALAPALESQRTFEAGAQNREAQQAVIAEAQAALDRAEADYQAARDALAEMQLAQEQAGVPRVARRGRKIVTPAQRQQAVTDAQALVNEATRALQSARADADVAVGLELSPGQSIDPTEAVDDIRRQVEETDAELRMLTNDHMIANATYAAVSEKLSDMPMDVMQRQSDEVLSNLGRSVGVDIKPVKAPKTGGRIQREMESLGIKVVWFRPSSKKFNSPGFHTLETRGTIYLNADANMSSVRAKAYHEVFHDIQMFRPEIAEAYSQQVGLAPIYAAGAQYAEGQAESAAKGRADAFARIQAAVAAAGIEGVDVEVPAAVSRIGAARLEQEGQAEAFGPTAARVGGRGVLSPLVRFAARRGLMGREVAGAMSVIDAVARAAAVEKAAGVKPDATLSPLGRTLLWMEDMSVDIPAEIEQASQPEAEQAQPAAPQAPQAQPAGVSMARDIDGADDEIRLIPNGKADTLRKSVEVPSGVRLVLEDWDGEVFVGNLNVPERERGTGIGSSVMRSLVAQADRDGTTLFLAPAGEPGSEYANRLVAFYKQFGFQPGSRFGDVGGLDDAETMSRAPGISMSRELSDEQKQAMRSIAELQRGEPEDAMLLVQNATGGGVLNTVVEHGGDIVNRIAGGLADFDQANLLNEPFLKTRRVLGLLSQPYGFEKEMMENLRDHSRTTGRPVEEIRAEVDARLRDFANAHRKIPNITLPIRLANQANIAVGEGRFDDAASLFRRLLTLIQDEQQYEIEARKILSTPSGISMAREPRPLSSFTPEWREWFGDSKVVDDQGRPLVVYHATRAAKDFGEFKITKDLGFHFTPNADSANRALRTRMGGETQTGGARIYPVYLSIKNPIRIEETGSVLFGDIGGWEFGDLIDQFYLKTKRKESNLFRYEPERFEFDVPEGMDTDEAMRRRLVTRTKARSGLIDETPMQYTARIYKEIRDQYGELPIKKRNSIALKRFAADVRKLGFDGFVYKNVVERGGDSWIALDSNQIKSVFNERPTSAPGISMARESDAEAASLREQIAVLQRQIRDVQNVTAAQRTNAIREVRILERRLLTAERVAEQKTLQATRAKMRVELEREAAKEDMAAADAQIAKLQTRLDSAKASVESLKQELGSLRRGENLEQRLADAEETAQRAIDFAYAIGRREGLVAGEIEGQRKGRREVRKLTERLGEVGSALEETQATMEEEAAAAQGRIDLAYAIGRREGLVSGQVAGQKQERRVVRKLSERLAIVEERLNTAVPALREARRQIKQDAAAAQRAINFAYGMGLAKGRVQGVMEGRRQVLKRMAQREDTLQRQLFELREMSRMRADQKEQVADAVRRIAADAAKMLPESLRGPLAVKIANAKTLAQANRIAVDAVKLAVDSEIKKSLAAIVDLRKKFNKRGMTYAARTRIEALLAQAEAGLKTTSGQRLRAAVQTQRGAAPVLVNAVDMYAAVVDAAALVEQANLLYTLDRQQYIAARAARIQFIAQTKQELVTNMQGRPVLSERERADRGLRVPLYKRIARANSDFYTLSLEVEGTESGALYKILRRLQEGKNESSLEYASILNSLEPTIRAAGYATLPDFLLAMGKMGEASAEIVTVTLGGQQVSMSLGRALDLAAMDDQTLSQFPDNPGDRKQPITFEEAKTTRLIFPTRSEIIALRNSIAPEKRALYEKMKEVLETIKPRLFQTYFEITGEQPPEVPGYWPISRVTDAAAAGAEMQQANVLIRSALTNVGFMQQRFESNKPLLVQDAFSRWERHVQVALDMVHMASEYREAMTLLGDGDIVELIDRQMGAGTAAGMRAILANGVGATARTQSNAIDRWTNNVTGATLALGPTTNAKIIVGGQVRLGSEIPPGYWARGVGRASRFRTPAQWSARVAEIHSLNGYFMRRHQMQMRSIVSGTMSDQQRVNLSTAWRSMIDGFRATGQSAIALQLQDAFDSLSQSSDGFNMMLSSVIDALRLADEQIMLAAVEARLAEIEDEGVLQGQDALREASNRAEMDFRRTQNASDEFDETFFAATARVQGIKSLLRVLMPFVSDPLKARNQIRRAYLSGERRAQTAGAIASNAAASTIINLMSAATMGYLLSALFSAFGGAGPDDEQEKEVREQLGKIPTDLASEIVSSSTGMWGILLVQAVKGIMYRRPAIFPLIARPIEQASSEFKSEGIVAGTVPALLALLQYRGVPLYRLYDYVRDVVKATISGEKSSTTKEPQSPRDRLMERIERRRREIERARQGGAAVR